MSEVNRFRLRLRNARDERQPVTLSVSEVRAFITEYDELKAKYDQLLSTPIVVPAAEPEPDLVNIHVSGGGF